MGKREFVPNFVGEVLTLHNGILNITAALKNSKVKTSAAKE
ncbi:hypothetical protein [Clostridium ihumii]|nr:hypothetical protein [Clostridium ihumii]